MGLSSHAAQPPAEVAFLLSSPRAGSTLLSRVLDSHSEIASPCEICLPYVVAGSWKLHKSLATISKISNYYGAEVPRPVLRLATRTEARLHLARLVRNILLRECKQTLVIKDPRHAAHLERIERLCADEPPEYILLHRDARAVCHSFTSTLGRKPERGFRAWLRCTKGMLECQRRFPDRCLSIRYEDLVSRPAETTARVTAFLGHAFEASMLDYGQHDHADDHLGLWTNPRFISSVARGTIVTPGRIPWLDNQPMLQTYQQNPKIQAVNRHLGYDVARDDALRRAA